MAKSLVVQKQGLEVFSIGGLQRKEGVFKVFLLLGLFLMLSLMTLLSACAKATPAPSPIPPPPVTTAPIPPPTTEGKSLYTAKCASCHGPNAEGTAAGPAIAGHSMSAMMTQMRNPMGMMPAFPAGQLSDREANEIAEYIASLGEAKIPVQEWEKQPTETMHHWMALLAIKGGDAEDAKHHLQNALTFIKEPAKKTEMEKALSLIAQGNIHDAEHEIEEMAGSESPSGISMQRFHLILAQRGVEAENATEIKHHLTGHFLTLATESEKKLAGEAVKLAEKSDFHEAEHEIEELMEMSK